MKYDVIVIGSGLGGLECASLLARAGKHVLVLEQAHVPGGCLQSYRRQGLLFDTGFHYVGGLDEGQSLHNAFKCLGLLDLPWKRMDNEFDRIVIGGRSFGFCQGYGEFVENLSRDFPSRRRELEHLADLMKQSAEEQFALLNPHANAQPSAWLMETGAWTYLQETLQDPLLLNVLSAPSLKMELRRESLPLFAFLHSNSSFIESSWRLAGDGSQIVRALVQGIRAQGGEVVCDAAVQELTEAADGQLARAVCSNGEAYEAQCFVSDIHPAQTCALMKQNSRVKPAYRKRIASLENSLGMFTVSLVVRPRTIRYFNRNLFVFRQPDVWTFYTGDGPVEGVMLSCRVPEDGSGYATQIDLLTPMEWARCKAWQDTRVGQRGADYRAMKERMARECIALAETVLPGLGGAVCGCYTSTPLTYRDYTCVPEGSAYGLRKDFRNPLGTLLSVRTPVPNLYQTGQNVMLHGIHGVTMTALFTCAAIVGKEKIWNMISSSSSGKAGS